MGFRCSLKAFLSLSCNSFPYVIPFTLDPYQTHGYGLPFTFYIDCCYVSLSLSPSVAFTKYSNTTHMSGEIRNMPMIGLYLP
uniref:Uncharacterized protein n=2 Tax=Picea TaxID=3328 RepID=A0A124GMX9_PICGL|nr:hypothetical protein ABT39_MTgene6052 [Picea glauca]QHR91439.1 hypothetical protein Q903MT_gene5473 [Picea sitchensis]